MKKILLLTLFCGFGCDSDPIRPLAETDAAALTVTDSAEYAIPELAGEPVRLGLIFSNRTAGTVWIVRCGGPRPEVEKLVGGEWVRASGGAQLDCLQATSVEAGAQLRAEYLLYPEFLTVDTVAGTYRVVWVEAVWNFETRTSTSLFGDLLPLEYRVSNQFSLRPILRGEGAT